jgi:hypothetical protein
MGIASAEPERTGWISAGLVLIMHQVIAFLIGYFVASLAVRIVTGWLHLFGLSITVRQMAWLIGPPYYPAQICLALFMGWSLGGWLQHRSTLWVWLIPSVIMCCVVVAFPWVGQIEVKGYGYLSSPSLLSHFFGRGCRPADRCLDQLLFTVPFFSAVAYSTGAYVARVKRDALAGYAGVMSQVRMPRALLVGIASVCYDLIIGWPHIAQTVHDYPRLVLPMLFWSLLIELTLVTYVFIVVISLFGRRFSITRWFLNPKASSDDGAVQS